MEYLLKELEQLLTKHDACILRSAKEGIITVSKCNDGHFIDCEFIEEIDANDIKCQNYSINNVD